MRLRANTHYRTRDGRRAYVFGPNPFAPSIWIGVISEDPEIGGSPGGWSESGKMEGYPAMDLVAEEAI
jgi:hypothetical protein